MSKKLDNAVKNELNHLSDSDFSYKYKEGKAEFVIYTPSYHEYHGFATCAQSDKLFESEKVGLRIARYRALRSAAMSEISNEKVRDAVIERINKEENYYIETQDKFNKRVKQLRKMEKRGIKPESALPLLLD